MEIKYGLSNGINARGPLNDCDGYSLVAGLFKCNSSTICAAFYEISNDVCIMQSLGNPRLFVTLLSAIGILTCELVRESGLRGLSKSW